MNVIGVIMDNINELHVARDNMRQQLMGVENQIFALERVMERIGATTEKPAEVADEPPPEPEPLPQPKPDLLTALGLRTEGMD